MQELVWGMPTVLEALHLIQEKITSKGEQKCFVLHFYDRIHVIINGSYVYFSFDRSQFRC